jgi:hypothetical protein
LAAPLFILKRTEPVVKIKAEKTLINEDFCSLARRERFLSVGIYGYISSLKNVSNVARGQKDH